MQDKLHAGSRQVIAANLLGELVAGSSDRYATFQSAEFRAALGAHLDELHERSPIKAMTVDIFDTAILRRPESELSRFLRSAERLAEVLSELGLADVDALEVLAARLGATKLAYRLSTPVFGCREGRFGEIARGILRQLCVPVEHEDLVWEAERSVELANLTPSPLATCLLEWCAENEVPIYGLSDMYLEAHRIIDLLQVVDANFASGIQGLTSSADTRFSKASGHAFTDFARRHQLVPGDLVHVGDNPHTDYLKPISMGLRAVLVPLPRGHEISVTLDERDAVSSLLARSPNFPHVPKAH